MISILIVLNVITIALVAWGIFRQSFGGDSSIKNNFDNIEKNLDRIDRLLRDEVAKNREELNLSLSQFSQSLLNQISQLATLEKNQLDTFSNQLSTLTQMNEQKLDKLREVLERQLKLLQDDNSQKLEKIRATVDEKLHATLEKRLGESFQLVSERLEKVHEGLGEMQTLASGVGDLKKVLSNVKTRGIWGEVQLGNLLEQILTPEQYERNMVTKQGSRDPVEFAIKFQDNVFLPIDAKFPTMDYERLQEAQEAANPLLVEEALKALEARLKLEAKNIRDKYLDPPHTTDFGILFLPTESLYAEVLRRAGLAELLRREFKVIVTGPTTIAALLNSFQLGFRTLAVEKGASKVWTLLGAVKTEFGKFGDLLDKTHKKLQEASNTIESATQKSRTIERRLKDVQGLPSPKDEEKFLDVTGETINDNDIL